MSANARTPSSPNPDRRRFVTGAVAFAAVCAWPRTSVAGAWRKGQEPAGGGKAADAGGKQAPVLPFAISLAEWSLHRTLARRPDGKDNLLFPRKARALGIDAVEYVNTFWKDKARDADYLRELGKVCAGEGVQSVLIMCDAEGDLGDPDAGARGQAVANHHQWIDAAVALGCHSIRVNARSSGTWDEQKKLAADGLARLSDYGSKHDCNVIVENHGGLSSNGKWLAAVLKAVDHPRCGSLPDFGNFTVSATEQYDRYLGTAELMPFAKGVSAKSHDFDDKGDEVHTDYGRMLRIVVIDAGYRGRIGIEYEGQKLAEEDGIVATKKLLLRVRQDLLPLIK